jgi:hypothetical protein
MAESNERPRGPRALDDAIFRLTLRGGDDLPSLREERDAANGVAFFLEAHGSNALRNDTKTAGLNTNKSLAKSKKESHIAQKETA